MCANIAVESTLPLDRWFPGGGAVFMSWNHSAVPPAAMRLGLHKRDYVMELRALIVEDDHRISAALKTLLGRRGVECRSADNGLDALNEIRFGEWKPDLMITDLDLPLVSGPELLLWVSFYRPDLPVLIASASTRYRYLPLNPAWAVVPKPFDCIQFLRACHQVLPAHFEDPQQLVATRSAFGGHNGDAGTKP
jgi:DNA-binding response OmpR family regulator